jgi:hypothetical protein
LWEDVPSHISWLCGTKTIRRLDGSSESFDVLSSEEAARIVNTETIFPEGQRTGAMSGRDIMQVFGTELMRNTFGNDVWLNATKEISKKSQNNIQKKFISFQMFVSQTK